MSGVDCLVPSGNDLEVATAFSAFVAAMNELNFVALARYSKKDGAPPVPALLSPGLEGETDVMYLNYLPFADDIREYQFESLSRFVVTEQMAKSIDALIDDLDLSVADTDPVNNERVPALAPERTYNPLLQRFYRTLHARLTDENSGVADIPPESRAALEPNRELFLNAEQTFKTLKDLFPLVKAPEPVKGRGRGRRDWRSEIAGAVSEEGLPEMHGDVSLSMSNLMAQQVTKVSTANPVADYCALVQDKDRAPDSTRQLFDVVIKLVKESFQGSGESKAVDCVDIARQVCRNLGLVPLFNDGLQRIRETLRDTTFWSVLRMKNILPISSEESASSTLPTGQAQLFYEEAGPVQGERPEEPTASIWEAEGWDDL